MSDGTTSATTPDLAFGQTWPTLDVFGVLARDRRVIPVVRRLMADAETPVGVYRKLAGDRPGTFLLESAEHGGVWSRWSIVGAAQRGHAHRASTAQAHWVGEPPVGVPTSGQPTEALRDTMAALATEPIAGLPPLTGGMVGCHHLRRRAPLGAGARDHPRRARLPELALMLATDLAVLDHTDGSILLVANAINYDDTDERVDDAWADAVRRLDAMQSRPLHALGRLAPSTYDVAARRRRRVAHRRRERYEEVVEACQGGHPRGRGLPGRAVAAVLARLPGVPARRLPRRCAPRTPARTCTSCACPSDPDGSLSRGRVRRRRLQPGGAGAGDGGACHHPPDRRLAPARQDPRGRRAPGRGAARRPQGALRARHARRPRPQRPAAGLRPGTVEVVEFMDVRRYSHVMHIESTVVGTLAEGAAPTTCSWRPSPPARSRARPSRARWSSSSSTSPSRRGVYGRMRRLPRLRTATSTSPSRSAPRSSRTASRTCRPAPGIVADSVPATEHEECGNKATAVAARGGHGRHDATGRTPMSDDAAAADEFPEPDRRGYRRALIMLAVGAGLLFLGYAQVWASAVVVQEGLPSLAVELKGREIQPAGSASAILALAGIAGLVATRRFGRAVTGVLLVLEGVIAVVGALWFGAGAGNRADVVRLVSEKAGVDVEADLAVRPWWLVVAVGGLLLVVVGVLAALRGGTWPVMGRRYERERPATADGTSTGPVGAGQRLGAARPGRRPDRRPAGRHDAGADPRHASRPRGWHNDADPRTGGHPMSERAFNSHGNTPAAWTAVTICMVAFVIGAVGVLTANWLLFWVGGVGLFILGGVVGKVMSMMGYGQGTAPAEH